MKRRKGWLRTDEREDAVRSLQWAATLAADVVNDPHVWKWQLVALHSAVQGFMVLALEKGNGLLALRPDIATKWLKAYRSRDTEQPLPYPADKLDGFMNLYGKIKESQHFPKPFVPGLTHDRSLRVLNELRNEFIHFTPKGWSLELTGLPDLLVDAAGVITWCTDDSGTLIWYKQAHRKRARTAVRQLRRSARSLREEYGDWHGGGHAR
jgi:hypothetical protein